MKTLATILTIFALPGCGRDLSLECRVSSDCTGDTLCIAGDCTRPDELSKREPDASTDVARETTVDGKADRVAHAGSRCRGAVAANAENLVLNEALVDVPSGPSGDANGDGVRDPYDDEFVELVNVADDPVDMKAVRILNADKMKFWFEDFCLLPGEAVVVFGGGTPSLAPAINVTVADTHFAFSNDGGTIRVLGPSGSIAEVDYGSGASGSLTLSPQLTGSNYVDHATLVPGMPFSPGTCADGRPTPSGCPDAGGDDAGMEDADGG